ncbi:MAG: LuxR C-terminal-related transcriptional regulator [Pseudomonadota bacterium]
MTRKPLALWALFGLQAFCAAFFLADGIADVMGVSQSLGVRGTASFEYAIALALIFGLVFTGLEIRAMLSRQARLEQQARAASGAFAELLEEHFDTWALTPSERDVALLAIKGLSIAEIAALRNTKEGTIKAQCNAIYRKAGVSGRPQLLSVFIEDLMGQGLTVRQVA